MPAPGAKAATRVLVVEDDPDVAHPLRHLLEHYGYDARTSDTVADALGQIDAWMPRAVLLDLALPDGNGVTVLRHVRRRHPSMSVAVLSGALAGSAVPEAIAQLRPDRVFFKPAEFLDIKAWLVTCRAS